MLKSTQQALGLYRTPNQLGVAQDGAFVRLDECVIRSKDVVEPRLGQILVGSYIGSNASDPHRFNSLFNSSVGMLGQYGKGTDSGVVFIPVTGALLTNVPPPSAWVRSRFADCQKRCYMTSDSGIKRILSTGSAGAAGGLVGTITTKSSHSVKDSSGFAAANSACMYRADLVSFAPDNAEIVGPQTNRYYMRTPADGTIAIGAASRVSGTTTIITGATHGLRVGDSVTLAFNAADVGVNKFSNGAATVTGVTSSTVFNITTAGTDYANSVAATTSCGPAYAVVRVGLPSTATTSDVVRLYRSELVTTSSLATPSDDVYQVFEAYLTAGNISAGYVDITDNTPEVLLGDPAYFSPSVEGENGRNDPPPLAWDLCAMGDVLMLSNLTFKNALELRLIATSSASGYRISTTLTFTRSGYTAFTVEAGGDLTADFSIVYYGDSTSVARPIEATALDLCDTINTHSTNTWLDAKYVSSATDAPGMILLTARDFVSTPFTVTTNERGSAWAPNIPTSGTTLTSRQETDPAGLMWSKPGQPDAFPPFQRGRAGPTSEKALRILPVREKAIVLKEKSAWLVSGAWPNYRVDLLDNICGFHLPDTAAVLDNQVFALSSIGVVAVSEAGISLMGTPIEGDTREVSEQAARAGNLLDASITPPCLASWGASDSVEHRYLLALPSPLGAQEANVELRTNIIWVFNAGPKAWSGPWHGDWRHAARWPYTSSSSRLAFALQSLPAIAKESGIDVPEALRYADYLGQRAYVSAKSGNTLTLLSASSGTPSAAGLQIGDGLMVSSANGPTAIITGIISAAAGTVTVDDATAFAPTTAVTVVKAYEAIAEWVPQHLGALPADSQMHTAVLALSEQRYTTATVRASSELSGGEQDAKTLKSPGFGVELSRDASGNLTDAGFGTEPFGHLAPLRRERVQIPRDVQRGGFHSIIFRVREAGAYWRLHGLSLEFEAQSDKGTR